MSSLQSPAKTQAFPPEITIQSLGASIEHIIWTLQNSPQSYKLMREELRELADFLMNIELRSTK